MLDKIVKIGFILFLELVRHHNILMPYVFLGDIQKRIVPFCCRKVIVIKDEDPCEKLVFEDSYTQFLKPVGSWPSANQLVPHLRTINKLKVELSVATMMLHIL